MVAYQSTPAHQPYIRLGLFSDSQIMQSYMHNLCIPFLLRIRKRTIHTPWHTPNFSLHLLVGPVGVDGGYLGDGEDVGADDGLVRALHVLEVEDDG